MGALHKGGMVALLLVGVLLALSTFRFVRLIEEGGGISFLATVLSVNILSPPPPPSGGGGGGGGGGSSGRAARVSFEGWSYPAREVQFFLDGALRDRVRAGADGAFFLEARSLRSREYTFGFNSIDVYGRTSKLVNVTLALSGGETAVVADLLLPPTVGGDVIEVKRGEPVTLFGQATPGARITVRLRQSGMQVFQGYQEAGSDGTWKFSVPTASLQMGNAVAEAFAVREGATTTLSLPYSFLVGDRTVKGSTNCPVRADLNRDCKVNLTDFSIAAYWWERTLTDKARTEVDAKLWEDGKVDLRDFSILAYYWTG